MTLTVVACATPHRLSRSSNGYVLRLAGPPEPDDVAPPHVAETADKAAAHLRATFPDWLWQWVQASGVLELATYPGPISWWWYAPLSEMSPIRSPLIRDLYWLILLRSLVQEHRVDRVIWIGDDRALAGVAREVATGNGATFEALVQRRYRLGGLWKHVAHRVRYGVEHTCRCLALRLAGFGRIDRRGADVLLYSRFPVLWETGPDGWRERMYADWPQLLTSKGHSVLYGAAFSGSLLQIANRRREFLSRCVSGRILIVEALASVGALISAHLDVRFFINYFRWRRRQPRVVFDGFDVSAVFWRELDASATSPEIPFDRVLAATLRTLFDETPHLNSVFFPFEYQPMERAVCVAAKQRGKTTIGLQTALYTSNQMGFTFPRAQVRAELDDAARAPLPDAIAAYGELPYQVFAARLGEGRVFLVGPIRYAHLAQPPRVGREEFLNRHNLPPGATVLLVTTSTVRAESIHILEAAFQAAATIPGVVLALKFHYHLPLRNQVERLTHRYPTVNSRIFDVNVDVLLSASAAMICGGSSTGIEAMARGCMPLVFQSIGELLPNPMLDVADAAFFWHTPQELVHVLSATLTGDEACSTRRARWPSALRAHLSPLAIDMNSRLYAFLLDHTLVRREGQESSRT